MIILTRPKNFKKTRFWMAIPDKDHNTVRIVRGESDMSNSINITSQQNVEVTNAPETEARKWSKLKTNDGYEFADSKDAATIEQLMFEEREPRNFVWF